MVGWLVLCWSAALRSQAMSHLVGHPLRHRAAYELLRTPVVPESFAVATGHAVLSTANRSKARCIRAWDVNLIMSLAASPQTM
jgi:hypothetical protein